MGTSRTGDGELNTNDVDFDTLTIGLASTASARPLYDAAEHDLSPAVYER